MLCIVFDYTGKAIDDMGNYDGCIRLNQSVAHYCVLETVISVTMVCEYTRGEGRLWGYSFLYTTIGERASASIYGSLRTSSVYSC